MIEDKEFDTAEEVYINKRKKKLLLIKKQNDEDMYKTMTLPAGRNCIWNILSMRGPYTLSFCNDPYLTAFNEGARNTAIMLTNELIRVCPELYLLAQKEAIAKQNGENDE